MPALLQAFAFGADCVLLGRPICHGLAMGGQDGVEKVLETLHEELTLDMALAGEAFGTLVVCDRSCSPSCDQCCCGGAHASATRWQAPVNPGIGWTCMGSTAWLWKATTAPLLPNRGGFWHRTSVA